MVHSGGREEGNGEDKTGMTHSGSVCKISAGDPAGGIQEIRQEIPQEESRICIAHQPGTSPGKAVSLGRQFPVAKGSSQLGAIRGSGWLTGIQAEPPASTPPAHHYLTAKTASGGSR